MKKFLGIVLATTMMLGVEEDMIDQALVGMGIAVLIVIAVMVLFPDAVLFLPNIVYGAA